MRNELIHETIRDFMHESRLSNKAIVEQVVLLQKEVASLSQQLQDSVRLTNELLKEMLLQSLKSGSGMEHAPFLKENKKNSSSSSSRSEKVEASFVIDPWQKLEQQEEVANESSAEAESSDETEGTQLASIPVEAVSTYAWASGPDPRVYQRGFPTAQGKFVSSQQQDFNRDEFEPERSDPELTQEELAQLGRIYFGR
jgi:hypothetical protein